MQCEIRALIEIFKRTISESDKKNMKTLVSLLFSPYICNIKHINHIAYEINYT